MIDKTLPAQVKALEAQLAVLKAQVKTLSTPTVSHSFADLYSILSGKADSSEEEIDAMQYRIEWEGQQERQYLNDICRGYARSRLVSGKQHPTEHGRTECPRR
jgi:hypothetical protein